MRSITTLVAFIGIALQSFGQYSISNGVGLPSKDTLRVLIVFAEVDFGDGPCRAGMTESFTGSWGEDERGNATIPPFAGDFLDVAIGSEGPKGLVTKQFHEASFGQYVILGDYIPHIVTVPCKAIGPGHNGVRQVLTILNTWFEDDSTLYTQSGLPLNAFDLWSNPKRGEEKVKESDGRIDLLYIMWRNNRMLTGRNTMSNAGYGVARNGGIRFKNMKGLNNMASFNAADNASSGKGITIAEHLHGIYGGNHWHTAGGAGTHTFMCIPRSYGLTGQAVATSQMVSGWDRWIQRWKHPEKEFVTSAFSELGKEINTELVNINDHAAGLSVVLRDFSTTGDAVRVKLPYVSDDTLVKSQYLWLENHQFIQDTDEYLQYACSNNLNGRFPKGTPGIYAYVQVGKDERDGGNEIYATRHGEANGLASSIYPLTAEGNYDMAYRFDLIPDPANYSCFWNNSSIPVDRTKSKPNPLTGHSDLFSIVDNNNDGKLHSGDRIQLGFTDLQGDSLVHNYFANGDWKDAFAEVTGNMELSIHTNPAPVPKYTLASNYQFKKFGYEDGEFGAFENRTIWLNGLSVKFTELPAKKIQVEIRWDDFEVEDDVRWCGNIALSPNHLDSLKPSLILKECKKIELDRGESATIPVANGRDKKGNWEFTEPTIFTMLPGSVMELERKSKLYIRENSRMVISKGATLKLGEKSKIVVGKNAELIIEDGSNLTRSAGSKIIER